uniref:G_PROTEIN_RECEP_F1_2 domain-containing protein n=1 Tax=Ascaris lumbricoides TaxID=6252 RepID=A0A0M3ITW8_ASCLU
LQIRLESPFRLVRVRIFKCIDNIEGNLFAAFILYMFVLGFAIPVFLIVLFYGLLVKKLLTRSRSIPSSQIRLESPFRLVRVRIFKCIDNIEGNLFAAFILYMFVLGFAIPVFLIVLFYGLLVKKLLTRSRSIPSSQVPVNRIAIHTMAISIFFVVCWSPYWIATLYGLYRSQYPQKHASTTFIYVMYGIHALPYVNSASNWLLYGIYFIHSDRKKAFAISALTEIRSFQGI